MDWAAHRSGPAALGPGPGRPPAKHPEGGSPGAKSVRAQRLARRVAARLVLAPSAPAVIRLSAGPAARDLRWLAAGAG